MDLFLFNNRIELASNDIIRSSDKLIYFNVDEYLIGSMETDISMPQKVISILKQELIIEDVKIYIFENKYFLLKYEEYLYKIEKEKRQEEEKEIWGIIKNPCSPVKDKRLKEIKITKENPLLYMGDFLNLMAKETTPKDIIETIKPLFIEEFIEEEY